MLSHKFYSPIDIAWSLLSGNTLLRTLFNVAISSHKISGKVLDLGSKSSGSSYYNYLRSEPGTQVTYSDMQPAPGLVTIDVEEPFDISSQVFDTVLAFHLFEHVFHYQRAPSEIFRILRPGGRVLVSVPFLHEYHADPDDYIRLTDSALKRLWESAGFRCIHLEAIGEGLLTSTFTRLPTQILPRSLRPFMTALLYLLTTFLDRLIALRPLIDSRSVPERFALEFFAVFEKSEIS